MEGGNEATNGNGITHSPQGEQNADGKMRFAQHLLPTPYS